MSQVITSNQTSCMYQDCYVNEINGIETYKKKALYFVV